VGRGANFGLGGGLQARARRLREGEARRGRVESGEWSVVGVEAGGRMENSPFLGCDSADRQVGLSHHTRERERLGSSSLLQGRLCLS